MPDREKVIREYENYVKSFISLTTSDDEEYEMHEAVLALLKEQEAVVPYQHDAVWLCGNCEKEVVGWDDDIDGKENRFPFCRQCGRQVKWNEMD